MPPRKRKPKVRKPSVRHAMKKTRTRRVDKSLPRKSAHKRKLEARKPDSRRGIKKARSRRTGKSWPRKSRPKLPGKPVAARPLPAQPEEILFRGEGKMSTFGGPHNLGMAANEDLALFNRADLQDPKYAYLFLPASPPGTRLDDPDHCLTLTWAGPNADSQETGPFRTSPGAGLRGLNCDDEATSRRSGSKCTPKGTYPVEGFQRRLNSDSRATYVTWFMQRRGIALHYFPACLSTQLPMAVYESSQGT